RSHRALFLPAELQLEQLGERRIGGRRVALLLGGGIEAQRRAAAVAARRTRPAAIVARPLCLGPTLARGLVRRPIGRPTGARALAPALVLAAILTTLGPRRVGEELPLVQPLRPLAAALVAL